LAFTESVEMAGWVGETDKVQQKKIADYEASMSKLADAPGYEGEWMGFLARTLEAGKPAHIYAYANRSDGKWQFDMHIENPDVKSLGEPCFGWKVPHIYVPVGEIFIATYDDCKKLLGLTAGEDV